MLVLPKINNVKALATTSVGVGFSQLIALLSVPFIARMSGPEVFGEYSYYNSVVVILCVFTSLKLELSILTIAWRLYPYLKLLVAWLLPIMAVVFGGLAAYIVSSEGQGPWLLSAIIFLLLGACQFEFFIQDNIKQGKFRTNALMRIVRAVSVPLVFLVLDTQLPITPELILVAFAVANMIAVFFSFGWSLVWPYRVWRKGVINGLVKSCWRVVVYLVPGHFLNRYSSGCLVLLSGIMGYQSSDIAKFSLIVTLLIAPVSIITTAVSDVVKRDLIESPLVGLVNYYRLSCYLIILAILGCLVFVFSSEYVIDFIMGPQWVGVSQYGVAMLPLFIAILIFTPMTHVYTIFNKQNYDFIWQCCNAIVVTVSVVVGLSFGFVCGVWAYAVTSSIMLMISAVICRSIIVEIKQ